MNDVDSQPTGKTLLEQIWDCRTTRLLLLAPNALTFLMQFEDVSAFLRRFLAFWRPIYEVMERWTLGFVPPAFAPIFIMSVLFLPFATTGGYDLLLRGRWTVTIPTTAVGLMMYLVVIISGVASVDYFAQSSNYWTFLAGAATVAAVETALAWLISRPLVRSLALIHVMSLLMLFAVALVAVALMTPDRKLVGLAYGLLMLCPLLNIRRLRDLGLIVGGLLVAVLIGDSLSGL